MSREKEREGEREEGRIERERKREKGRKRDEDSLTHFVSTMLYINGIIGKLVTG